MRLFSKFQYLLPALRVHIWGGLGSQLFGLVTANRLHAKWPDRRITLVFHSSGVTQRFVELRPDAIFHYKIIQKFDFDAQNSRQNYLQYSRTAYTNRIKGFIKFLLFFFKFLGAPNSDTDYSKIRPWLISVRGHYSEISIQPIEVHFVANLLSLLIGSDLILKDTTFVHLRLGDLLSLENKSHIPIERLAAIPEVTRLIQAIHVFSDSDANVAEALWRSKMNFGTVHFSSLDVYQVIRECVRGDCFIGTNSKISLWVTILRLGLKVGTKTYLPLEMHHYAMTTLFGLDADKNVAFY